MTCPQCGEPAEFRCSGRHLIQFTVRLKTLRPSDTVLAGRNEIRASMRYHITELERIWNPRRRNAVMFGYVRLAGGVATATLKVNARRPWRVERWVPCGAVACFRHVREVDEGVYLCWHCARQQGVCLA
jgi:hypothetical protein